MGIDAGDLLSIDFTESTDVMSAQEQREQWEWELSHGLIDEADVLMQMNPDGFPDRDSALDHIFDRKKIEPMDDEEEEASSNMLRDALTKRV